MSKLEQQLNRIKRVCTQNDLSTFDPYDIWKTRFGFQVKSFYNRHHSLGLLPAAALTIFDTYVNGRWRLLYSRQEYPIVRAWAALVVLNVYEKTGDNWAMEAARNHLDWLCKHSCRGYSGPCWGLGFDYAVSGDFAYDSNQPLTTVTPYPLEAFVRYSELSGDDRYVKSIQGIFEFLERDIEVMEEDDDYLVTSYAAMRDRRVINAVSYVMFSYSLLLPYIDGAKRKGIEVKIRKLYAYILSQQGPDGSWMYSPEGQSFIDCFHSCIVLKNLIKTNATIDLPGAGDCIERGYRFLKEQFLVPEKGLFKRFALHNKPSIVRFDLYDNSEMLNLSYLMNDIALTKRLEHSVDVTFVRGDDIYSQIDCFGFRHGRNTLRWALMPYLYALSVIG
jgi:hypothetical protein